VRIELEGQPPELFLPDDPCNGLSCQPPMREPGNHCRFVRVKHMTGLCNERAVVETKRVTNQYSGIERCAFEACTFELPAQRSAGFRYALSNEGLLIAIAHCEVVSAASKAA
jgi:hypothetical protein